MAIDVDGAAVLRAIAGDPKAFSMSQSAVNGIALDALIAVFKAKDVKLATIRTIFMTIGNGDFSIAVGALKPKDLESLNRKLDAKHPEIKTLDGSWHRTHVLDLAKGAIDPVAAQASVKAAPKPKPLKPLVPKIGKILDSAALKAGARSRAARTR